MKIAAGLKNIVTGCSLIIWLFLHYIIWGAQSFFNRIFGRKNENTNLPCIHYENNTYRWIGNTIYKPFGLIERSFYWESTPFKIHEN